MRKIKIYLLLIAAVSITSCKKVLDVQSYTSVTDATAFETADRCLLALNGVYDAAQSGPYAGGTERRGYPFGAANIEQGDARGEDVINIAAFYQITYQGTYNGTSANCVAMWDNAYSLINKVNISIDGFKAAGAKGTITTAVATQYEAECRFLRAMAHHEVVLHFARPYLDGNGSKDGIPFRDFAVNSGTAVDQVRAITRGTVAQDYQKILADLDFAEANLPALQSGAAALSTYRATKAAAIAVKMRVKMHMGDWAGVLAEGNKLVPAAAPYVSPIGAWTLNANPDGAFASNTTKESVFSVKNDALDAPSVNGGLAYMLGATNLGGRGLVAVSPIIWNNTGWLCTDKRRTLLYVNTGGNANGSQSILTNKYRDYVNRSDFAPQVRYAEVLLMLAEAEARQAAGVSQRAIDLLNAVRNRALASAGDQYTSVAGFTQTGDVTSGSATVTLSAANPNIGVGHIVTGTGIPANTKVLSVSGTTLTLSQNATVTTAGVVLSFVSFPTKNSLIAGILLERRIEFLFEGKRWGDISRLVMDPTFSTNGIPAKAVNGAAGAAIYNCGTAYTPGQAAIPYSDFRFIWPIPTDEVTQNPIIKQNPGY